MVEKKKIDRNFYQEYLRKNMKLIKKIKYLNNEYNYYLIINNNNNE